MNFRLLILPGWQDSGEGHWQTLFGKKYGGIRVEQEDWMYPDRAAWVTRLEEAISADSRPVVLLAHSLGCILAVHWGALDNGQVKGAFLVAPPDLSQSDTPKEITPFGRSPNVVLPFPSMLVATSSDQYATEDALHKMAAAWGSAFHLSEGKGHINIDSGNGPWPEGERLFEQCLAKWHTSNQV